MKYSDSKIKTKYKRLSELHLNRFDYKGYYTLIHFDSEDKVLYGKYCYHYGAQMDEKEDKHEDYT